MPTYKLTIEYEGTRYSGWQAQGNTQKTVQGHLIRAATQIFGEVDVGGAGRTDAGVHASGQVAHLRIRKAADPLQITRKLNDLLPHDIHVLHAVRAADGFHARHDAESRVYLYQISRRRAAFAKPFVWWIREPLRLERMREAAAAFIGMQNFEAFTADDPDEKSTKVLVDAVDIEEHGALVLLRVRGSHFLWKMVRRMVGVLAAVGRGEIASREAAGFLDPSRTSDARATAAALAAPSAGLFLEAVRYAGDPPIGPIQPVINIER